jgi:hypothetical protein
LKLNHRQNNKPDVAGDQNRLKLNHRQNKQPDATGYQNRLKLNHRQQNSQPDVAGDLMGLKLYHHLQNNQPDVTGDQNRLKLNHRQHNRQDVSGEGTRREVIDRQLNGRAGGGGSPVLAGKRPLGWPAAALADRLNSRAAGSALRPLRDRTGSTATS